MKRIPLFLLPLAGLISSSADADQEVNITKGLLDCVNVEWTGQVDRFYFVQGSDDLENWFYFDILETGDLNSEHSFGFSCNEERLFFRLAYHDETGVVDADAADFDNDGLSNLAELIHTETDPLDEDTGDTGTLDGARDSDADGKTNTTEVTIGTSPDQKDNPKLGLSVVVIGQ